MIKYLFASHGTLSQGVYDSLKLIMGKQNNVYTFSAYQDGSNDVEGEIKKYLGKIYTSKDTWIIVTDIYGGSVNNCFMELKENYQFYLVSGLCLPLVLNLLTQITDSIDIDTKIDKALEDTKKQIINCDHKRIVDDENNDF